MWRSLLNKSPILEGEVGLVCTSFVYVKSEIRNVAQENQASSGNKDTKFGSRKYLTSSLPLKRFRRLTSRLKA